MLNSPFISFLSLGILANLASGTPVSERSAGSPRETSIQHLTLSFTSRSQAGKVAVSVQPNNDNDTAFGLSIIYSPVPQSDYFAEFHGFPVVKGAITYPIPASPHSGYGALFGWIQFIKNTTANVTGDYAVDSYPFASDLGDPFGGWGFNPSHFDAPAILLEDDPTNQTIIWRAQTYLTELADAGVSKNVTVVKDGAFTWGFDMTFDADGTRHIAIVKAQPLGVDTEWGQRLPLLTEQYPKWTFNNATVVV
jgi:hypothetical protein